MTIVMVLHDLNQASQYSDRVCVMKDGEVVIVGKPEEVFTTKLVREVYNVEARVEVDELGYTRICPLRIAGKYEKIKESVKYVEK